MRSYPRDKYDKEELELLNTEPWMVELLKCNPEYPFWGNYEDYMSGGNGQETEEYEEKTLKDWDKFVVEFVVIEEGKIARFISNTDYQY